MGRQPVKATIPLVRLDRRIRSTLQVQIFKTLRGHILSGSFQPGTQLPSTRMLASQLGVSRNTIIHAIEKLAAEGFAYSEPARGTFVADIFPRKLPPARQSKVSRSDHNALVAAISVRSSMSVRPLAAGLPDVPRELRNNWARLISKHVRQGQRSLFTFGDPRGHLQLRKALVEYLGLTRGVNCTPDQIVVVSGSQHAFNLVLGVMKLPTAPIAIEEPGHLGFRAACTLAQRQIMPVPVDQHGLKVHQLPPQAGMVFVCPSCQYPTGVTLSLSRRLELLEWSTRRQAWIIEYDYLSALRYRKRPLHALQGLDRHGRVFYIGTFSETIFPALRIAYVVAPADLSDDLATANAKLVGYPALVEQSALAEFVSEGHLSAHIRRMEMLYERRAAELLRLLREKISDKLMLSHDDGSLHIGVALKQRVCDVDATEEIHKTTGIEVAPLSPLYAMLSRRSGLLLGYAPFTVSEIRQAVEKLAPVLKRLTESY